MQRGSIIFSVTVLGACLVLLTRTAELAETKKEVPPPGKITFIGKNAVATANGTFKKWAFTKVEFDPDNPGGAIIELSVDVASIDTKIKRRDNHLRTEDSFDVENYPTATLKFYDVKSGKDVDTFVSKLDFKIHGIQKTFSNFRFTVVQRNPIEVEGKFTFNRLDFKIGDPKTINPMSVKEEIPISFSATLPQ